MKTPFVLFLASVILGFWVPGNIRGRAAGDAISTIKSQYVSINKNVGRYKMVKRDAAGFSAEGGTLEAYFDASSIKKIRAHFYGEMGRADEEYYYWNDKLIFVFRKESTYDLPLSGKVVSTKENRYYFSNGRMIRWLNQKGQQIPASNAEYKETQDACVATSGKLTEIARS